MSSYFYIPGGPGLSCAAEEHLIAPLLPTDDRLTFWKEPLRRRWPQSLPYPGATFSLWKDQLKQDFLTHFQKHGPSTVIAHSFGSHGALLLAQNFPEAVQACYLIAPCLNNLSGIDRFLAVVIQHFREDGNPVADKLSRSKSQIRLPLDTPSEEILTLACQDTRLFDAYWVNPEAKKQWQGYALQPPEGLDGEMLFGVFKTIDFNHLHLAPSNTPLFCLWGEKDPITDVKEQEAILRQSFRKVQSLVWKEVGHFPHLEKPQLFVSWLKTENFH